jgi:hypothetical protein
VFQVLSDEYAQNILACLPQDWRTLYVYWDFSGVRDQVARDFLQRIQPDGRLTVRLCRFDPGNREFTPERAVIVEQIATGNYYFRDLDPADTYCFEIGVQKPAGEFIRFYQTNPVRLQPATQQSRPAVEASAGEAVLREETETPAQPGRDAADGPQQIALSSWN